MSALDFIKSELANFDLNFTPKSNGMEGVDLLFRGNQLYLQSIDLGELKDNLFIALVLIMEKHPRVVYLIPSRHLSQSDRNIFLENEVSLMPSLSNWEIKVSSNTIPELAKYSLENMIDKLKT